ncbi:hypothetical protein Patl1_00408 [Pistacia atlantica]|uniref:Uncharacterized protein n=1 Tax=Pistacia atlantica TaxID=434234 RepID=A0ACC1C4J9_9ROSI|nr:hypothetical protein Patl1_00408 [Pistacia atlantica]
MADTILTSEKSSSSSSLNPPTRTVCHVCQKQFSQYTCPRCNTRYCSLKCYQSHSRSCTESFMRENVVDEMRHMQPDDETKQKMLEILKRLHSQEESDSMEEEIDSMDEDESTLSEETIQKILSGYSWSEIEWYVDWSGQVSFDDLSAKEKKLFQRAMASGALSKMIEPWDPWWLKPSARIICLSQQGTQLVQPLQKHEVSVPPDHDTESSESTEIPPGPETPLPPVSKLSSTEPSPLLVFHLVGSQKVCRKPCVIAWSKLALLTNTWEDCKDDSGRERELKSEKTKNSGRVETRRKLKLAERKIYFMMCWVHEQLGEAWSSAAAILKAEKLSYIDYGGGKSYVKMEDKAESRSKVLIKEME